MGVSESKCVNLTGQETYLGESYTVVRTSGEQQTGWLLTDKVHRCYNQDVQTWRPRAHAFLKQQDWALALHNGDHDDEDGKLNEKHACGWRTLGTFWPTLLTGDEAAIKEWTDKLRETIEELAGRQGVPDIWAEHSCGRGAGPDYCDGCCAQRRAKEKKVLLDELAAGPPEHRVETIKAELAKMPTAASHRLWKKYRTAADALEQARNLPTTLENIARVESLQAEMEAAEAAWRASLPPEDPPAAPPAAEAEKEPEDGRYERSVEQVEAELARAQANYRSALMSDPGRHGYDRACDNFQTEVDDLERELAEAKASTHQASAAELDAALAELGARPYHPVYAPLFKPLPEPMSAADRKLLGNFPAPERPTDHGCAYFDGAPWDICYACESEKVAQAGLRADGSLACEYERDSAAYDRKIRHSELVQLITAYWRSPSVGARAKGWSNETLEAIVGFLDTPKEARPYTDAQIADPKFSGGVYDNEMVCGLRELNA
jgi:hypothetical protein